MRIPDKQMFWMLLALIGFAFGDVSEQVLDYDLVVDGESVGNRTVTIRHIPPEEGIVGPSRMISSHMNFDVKVGGQRYAMISRTSARATYSTVSFAASVNDNGTLREVQGRRDWDGSWQITRVEEAGRSSFVHRRTAVQTTSMDVLDPEARPLLDFGPLVQVLVVETGLIIEGEVEELEDSEMVIGGERVTVRRTAWSPDGGRVELAWSEDGLLLAYQVAVLGKTLQATARKLPAPPTYGQFAPIQMEMDPQQESQDL